MDCPLELAGSGESPLESNGIWGALQSTHNVGWGDNNPLKALLGYQKKGWTDGEIGIEWIKHFDQMTCTKAKNEHRLLIVDGHNSHYTVPLLQYARENQIVIICYPAHGTHIYQGLDVVVFSPLKKYLSQERDNWFRSTGQPMDKINFLQIFSKAYVAALTPENIKMAFKKTGIHPYDPSVITESMLAPSKDTSYEVHLPVPMKQASEPVQALAKALRDLQLVDSSSSVHLPVPMKQASEPVQALAKALRDLKLVDSSSSVDTEMITSAAEIRSMETADVAGPQEVQITCSSNPVLNQSTRNSTSAMTSTTPSPSPDSTLH
ncbi:hypothetical protein CVT25_015812, partial [Psilocybe cyanescens]